ncbi:MAG TPA: M56 family metallopeptidase, partial [Polyangia bacterium]
MTEIVFGYFAGGLVAGVVGLVFAAIVRGLPRVVARQPRAWHRIGTMALLVALVLPAAATWLGGFVRGGAAFEIWQSRAGEFAWPAVPALTVSPPRFGSEAAMRVPLAAWVVPAALLGLIVGIGTAFVRLTAALRRLRRLCRSLPVVRRVGRAVLCASEELRSPAAARVDGRAYIIVPTALLGDGQRLRLVIAHEAQHHRRGDLFCALGVAILRALWFWNPAFRAWHTALSELEDIDCDRTAVRRLRVSSFDYASCLIGAAEALLPASTRVGVRAMAAPTAQALARRISALTERPLRRRLATAGAALLLVGALAGGTWAATGVASDRRVSTDEVARLAAQIQARTGFPVLASEPVVEALNRRVATPEARERSRAALARMAIHREMIEQVLQAHGLPRALIAVPFQESGFDAEAQTTRPLPVRAVGLWQLLPATARRFGLEVSESKDDRRDPRR